MSDTLEKKRNVTTTLGITGGIGSGKTTVCRMLGNLGAKVFYADDVGKRILVEDSTARAALTRLVGAEAYHDDGSLNRGYVASRVFADENMLAKLNLIVHPRVEAAFEAEKAKAEKHSVDLLVLEATLLFESELHLMLDAIAVVVSKRETRIERVVGRDGVTANAVDARMRHQADDKALLAGADYVIDNNGSLGDLERAVGLLFHRLVGPVRKKEKRHIRAR